MDRWINPFKLTRTIHPCTHSTCALVILFFHQSNQLVNPYAYMVRSTSRCNGVHTTYDVSTCFSKRTSAHVLDQNDANSSVINWSLSLVAHARTHEMSWRARVEIEKTAPRARESRARRHASLHVMLLFTSCTGRSWSRGRS
jgi:hypothetical protein